MNRETGEILNPKELKTLLQCNPEEAKKYKEMEIPPTLIQLKRKKVGRNDLCPCGSRKKFKNCCLNS